MAFKETDATRRPTAADLYEEVARRRRREAALERKRRLKEQATQTDDRTND